MRTIIVYASVFFVGQSFLNTFLGGWLSMFLAALVDSLLSGGGKENE
jgi:hypothetical protein